MLLVVVENRLHALDAGIFLRREILLHGCLVPIEDTTNEGRNEESTGLGGGDGLDEREHQSEVAVNALLLQDLGRLDTLPSGSDFDQDARLVDTDGLVELHNGQQLRFFAKGSPSLPQ